jgi:hypothetical protein
MFSPLLRTFLYLPFPLCLAHPHWHPSMFTALLHSNLLRLPLFPSIPVSLSFKGKLLKKIVYTCCLYLSLLHLLPSDLYFQHFKASILAKATSIWLNPLVISQFLTSMLSHSWCCSYFTLISFAAPSSSSFVFFLLFFFCSKDLF